MSKGVDYSKWNNFSDDEDEDEAVLVVPNPTSGRSVDADQEGARQQQQAALPSSSGDANNKSSRKQEIQEVIDMLKSGKVKRLMAKDCLSASALLASVNPGGLQDRKEAAARGEDLPGDPVHEHLWNLTLKLREDVKHVEELLTVHGVKRIMQVIGDCIVKYLDIDYKINSHSLNGRPRSSQEAAADLKIAKQLLTDTRDIYCALSVLHEMCRYRCGCVALAKCRKKLDVLMHLPTVTKRMVEIALAQLTNAMYDYLMAGDDFATILPRGAVDWACPVTYQFGMMEQALLDTFGRLLHGLDQNCGLYRVVSDRMLAVIDVWELDMKVVIGIQSDVTEWEVEMRHCIDIKGTLSKLRKTLAGIGANHSKGWHSTFRIDRQYVPTTSGEQAYKECEEEKGKCRACKKIVPNLQQCSRCRSVFYCSRECQVKDWKMHKKNCVKLRGDVPTDTSFEAGHTHALIEMLQERMASMK